MSICYRKIIMFCLCVSILLFSACKEKDPEPEGKNYMSGTLVHNVPQYVYRLTTYTFNASGITTPEDGLSYHWVGPGFEPDSCFTQTYTCMSPEKMGSYTISIAVSHEGYYDAGMPQYITVIDSLFFVSVTGIIPGTDSIVDPRDGTKYHTRIFGALEWFVQNLNWAGAGNPYAKVEALSTPYGRLYSWNEATSGVAAPSQEASSLGLGPQGACPPGWSVPTNDDWAHLASVVNGGTPISFFDDWDGVASPLCAYAKLVDVLVWPYSPRNTKSNLAAWNGLPGGNSTNNGNNYGNIGNYGFWLSSSEADAHNGYYRYIHYDLNQFPYHATDKNSFGASVRCVRLIATEPELPEE
ncbi:MAG: hypothetical protein FWD56_00195 [Bacteroidales bacterium]|nr:hypothetical protein [Bacteroidales bacterium]